MAGTYLALKPKSCEISCQMSQAPQTVKKISEIHDLASQQGIYRNMPPEPGFSLCHLVVFFSSDVKGEWGVLGNRLLLVLHNTNILASAKNSSCRGRCKGQPENDTLPLQSSSLE